MIDDWFSANKDFRNFPPSRRKLEWQAQDADSLWDAILQFRPSGIRAKAPSYVPALVAITQTSVVGGRRRRRLTPHEAARLQGLPRSFSFGGQPDSASYRQVGNGVAVGAAWHVFRTHVAQNRKRPSAVIGRECAPSCRKPGHRFTVAGRVRCRADEVVAVSRYAHVGLGRIPRPKRLRARAASLLRRLDGNQRAEGTLLVSVPQGLFALFATSRKPTRRRRVQAQVGYEGATSKAEAVARMYALGRQPAEPLGPGSKEKRSALEALGRAVGLDLTETPGKVECGRRIAAAVGATWDAECYSRGDTITLTGLNRLLEGAERLLADGSQDRPRTDSVYSNERPYSESERQQWTTSARSRRTFPRASRVCLERARRPRSSSRPRRSSQRRCRSRAAPGDRALSRFKDGFALRTIWTRPPPSRS